MSWFLVAGNCLYVPSLSVVCNIRPSLLSGASASANTDLVFEVDLYMTDSLKTIISITPQYC